MAKIQLRRDTAANWTSANPVLSAGEIGFETDTLRAKMGDGSTAWTSLRYGVARMPFSRATIAASTVLAQTASDAPLTMGAVLSAGTIAPTHTFASDGITVPAGDYLTRTSVQWNATNSAIRGVGAYDGAEYFVMASGAMGLRTTSTQLVSVSAATKIQPAYVADISTAAARTLSGSTTQSFSILALG